MEHIPTGGDAPEHHHEQELSFDQQVALAKALVNAVNKRNDFIERQVGFDTFAEAGQHVGGMRGVYDEMEAAVTRTRQEFDEKVSNKKQFIEDLRSSGETVAADMIQRMFNTS